MMTVKCYNCNKMGHYANNCGEGQKRDKSGTKEKEKSEGSTERQSGETMLLAGIEEGEFEDV